MKTLKSIRKEFIAFETTISTYHQSTARRVKNSITEALNDLGLPLADVDPAGKATNFEMQARLDSAESRVNLLAAQKRFAAFENINVTFTQEGVRSSLEDIVAQVLESGNAISALDPSGQSSDADIQSRIDIAGKRANLVAAQNNLIEFENWAAEHQPPQPYRYDPTEINAVKQGIISQLFTSGSNSLEALDPSGQSTEADIQTRLDTAEKRANLHEANEEFNSFMRAAGRMQIHPSHITTIKHRLVIQLAAGGETLAALGNNQSSEAEVEARLDAAITRAWSVHSTPYANRLGLGLGAQGTSRATTYGN